MPTIDTSYSTLDKIRIKVRRLTRNPSAAQLTDAQIDEYINTFVLYDFPQHIRPSELKTKLIFYTAPYVDRYTNNTINEDDPLYNFINRYTSIHPPLYIAGSQAILYEERQQFYTVYPQTTMSIQIGTGDGTTTTYTGTLSNYPITPGTITFTSVDVNNGALVLKDVQDVDPGFGTLLPTGTLQIPNVALWVSGTINYATGAYTITFSAAPYCPGVGQPIYCQCTPYTPAKPNGVLFFNNEFLIRPIPDQPYRVEMDAFLRPTELLTAGSSPEFARWFQYIAYGAAKKVFEDKGDLESVNLIMPEFKQQERLVLRHTIAQMSNERADGLGLISVDGDFGYKWPGR